MAWAILFVAGLFEIGWTIGLKLSDGFSKLWPSVFTAISLAASMLLLGIAVRKLPLGTAYAVWTGIGAAGAFACGILFFKEPATVGRCACVGLILAGILGLKLLSPQ